MSMHWFSLMQIAALWEAPEGIWFRVELEHCPRSRTKRVVVSVACPAATCGTSITLSETLPLESLIPHLDYVAESLSRGQLPNPAAVRSDAYQRSLDIASAVFVSGLPQPQPKPRPGRQIDCVS